MFHEKLRDISIPSPRDFVKNRLAVGVRAVDVRSIPYQGFHELEAECIIGVVGVGEICKIVQQRVVSYVTCVVLPILFRFAKSAVKNSVCWRVGPFVFWK
jgi:hypothetical protein